MTDKLTSALLFLQKAENMIPEAIKDLAAIEGENQGTRYGTRAKRTRERLEEIHTRTKAFFEWFHDGEMTQGVRSKVRGEGEGV